MHIFSSLIRVKDCFQIWMYTKSTVAFGVYIMYKYQLLYDQWQDTSLWSQCMWISHIALDFDSITFTYILKLWIIRHWCFESLPRHVETYSLRAASLLLSGSSCTCQVICLKIFPKSEKSPWKLLLPLQEKPWELQLKRADQQPPSHSPLLLAWSGHQPGILEGLEFEIYFLFLTNLAGWSGGGSCSSHSTFHHACVHVKVFESLLKLVHHLFFQG